MSRAPPPPHDLTGREAELARAEKLIGRLPVLVLTGVAGVGKTSLALALLERLGRAGARTGLARCGEGAGIGAALDGLADAAGVRVTRAAPLEVRAQAVAEAMDAGPVAVLLDDVHRLPVGALARLLRVLRRHLGRGRLICGARVDLDLLPEERLDYGRIEVGGLPRAPAIAWMRDLLERAGADVPGEDELRALHQRLGGHALLIKLSLGARVRGAVAGGPAVGRDFIEREILAGLPAPARAVLARLACFRLPVPPAALGPGAHGAALGELGRRQLVDADAEGLLHVHDLVREHVLDTLSPAERARQHAACADWLLAAPMASTDPVARVDTVIHHLLEAARPEQALALADETAETAVAGHRNEELLRWGERLSPGGRALPVRLALQLGTTYAREWRMAEAFATLADAERRAGPADRPLCLITRARLSVHVSEWPAVIAAFRELARTAGVSERQLLTVAGDCALAQFRVGSFRAGLGTLRRLRAGAPDLGYVVAGVFGVGCLWLGHTRFSARAFARAERLADEAGVGSWGNACRIYRAYQAVLANGPRQAEGELARARAHITRPLPSERADLDLVGALLDQAAGRVAEALRKLDDLVLRLRETPLGVDSLLAALEARASLRRDAGEMRGAEEDLGECRSLASRHGMRPWRAVALMGRGRLLALRGQNRGARRLLLAAHAFFAAAGIRREQVRALGALSDLALLDGDALSAEESAGQVLNLARAHELAPLEARAQRRLAECAFARGNLALALELGGNAAERAADLGDRRGEVGAGGLLARVLLAEGRATEAAVAAARMAAAAEELGHGRLRDEMRALEAAALQVLGRGNRAAARGRVLRDSPVPWVRAFAARLLGAHDPRRAQLAEPVAVLDPAGAASLAELGASLEGTHAVREVYTSEGHFLVGEIEAGRFRPDGQDIYCDADQDHAFVRGRRVDLALRPVMRDLLCFFLQRPAGVAVDFDTIYRAVWGGAYEPLRHERRVYMSLRRLDALLASLAGERLLRQSAKATWGLREGLRCTLVRRPRPRLLETLNPRQTALLRGLGAGEPVTNASYRQRFKVHRFTATRDLAKLASLGLLTRAGTGRSIRYVLR